MGWYGSHGSCNKVSQRQRNNSKDVPFNVRTWLNRNGRCFNKVGGQWVVVGGGGHIDCKSTRCT